MTPIFLIGYMGCGKTTLGRALARATGRPFYDLDFYIEQRFRSSVSRLFEQRGEDGFRQLEKAMLREVGEFDNAIISCGGGTPCFFDNMDYMLARGRVVWLQATPERLCERLAVSRSRRPLLSALSDSELLDFIERGLEARRLYYERASAVFDSTQLENRRQISDSVSRFLSVICSEGTT